MDDLCKNCGGPIAIRNPTGTCDHLYWPENLTDDAKRANGFVKVVTEAWVATDEYESSSAAGGGYRGRTCDIERVRPALYR